MENLNNSENLQMDPGNTNNVLDQKKDIKKSGKIIGFGIILIFILGSVYELLVNIIYSLVNNGNLSDFSGNLDNTGLGTFLSGLSSLLTMITVFFIIAALAKIPFSKAISFRKVKQSTLWQVVLVGITFSFILNLILNLINSMGINIAPPELPQSSGVSQMLANIFATALVAAFSEELIFRGAILGVLRKYGDWFAIIVSSLIFGLIHGNLLQIPFAFCMGVIFSIIFVKTNSIIPGMIIHFLNNLSVLLMDVINNNVSDSVYKIIEYTIYVALVALTILIILNFIKKDKANDFLKLENPSLSITFGAKLSSFVLNSPMILFLILIIFEILESTKVII